MLATFKTRPGRSYWGGGEETASLVVVSNRTTGSPHAQAEQVQASPAQRLSRWLAALDMDHTLIVVIEMSQSKWLIAGIVPEARLRHDVPGVEHLPLKKIEPDFIGQLAASTYRPNGATSSASRVVHNALRNFARCITIVDALVFQPLGTFEKGQPMQARLCAYQLKQNTCCTIFSSHH